MNFRPLGPLAAALLLAACGPAPREWPVTRDLATELPLCEVHREAEPTRPPRPPGPVDRNLAARLAEGIAIAGGVRIDGYLEVKGRAAIGIDGIASRGGAPGVEILTQVEGGAEKVLVRLEPGAKAGAWEIPGTGKRLVRWTFRATGDAAAWAIVRRPVVRSLSPQGPLPTKAATAPPPRGKHPNILLFLIDTLRADRVGAYGSTRGLTPRIDALARQGIVFERTTAASSWTRPSTATILTGLPPSVHGANRLDRRLPPAVRTLAEVLRDAGYRTGGFSANAHITAQSGFAQGFDRFEFLDELARGDALGRRALAWLDESAAQDPAPFFLYVHAIDPHAPYEPPEDLRRRFAGKVPSGSGSLAKVEEIYRALDRRRPEARGLVAQMAPLYDAEIAGIDRSFGALLDEMDRRGRLDQTLVVVISDHGEEFGEHGGLGHGKTLYREVLDVPWVVRLPGQTAARRVRTPVAHLDVMPTILAALGIPAGAGLRGIDRLSAETLEGPRFSHLDYEGRQGGSVELGKWHLIEPWSRKFSHAAKLFDLADGQETRDLAAENPVRAGYLRSLLRAEQLADRRRFAASSPVGAEEQKALEALGYL